MIKYISKTTEYELKDGRIIKNPFIEPVGIIGLKDFPSLRIPFSMKIIESNTQKVINISEGESDLKLNDQNIETIVSHNGVEKEITVAFADGWIYDETQVVKWGNPSIEKLLNTYLTISPDLSLDIKSPETAFLVEKFLDNKIIIQGKKIKEHFKLTT